MIARMRAWTAAILAAAFATPGVAQTLTLSDYFVQTVASGINQPTTMAFIGMNDFLICERTTGQVKRYTNGVLQGVVLDLPVNASSERGLLGICLDPNFGANGFVYIYYSHATVDGGTWTGNRVERFTWNGTTLTFNLQLINFAFDAAQSNGPNHDGGIIRIGPDDKLYIITGDLNRNRIEQNNQVSTTAARVGGVHRLNLDGTTPSDNPFFGHADSWIRTYWVYGVRNSFGMTFDPVTDNLWFTENGPASYDEVNFIPGPGANSGWNKIMGPDKRDPQGVGDLHMLPGAFYQDPIFSWLSPIAVTAILFPISDKFSDQFDQVWIGDNNFGQLYSFTLVPGRNNFVLAGDLLDRVADSTAERNLNRIGTGWGVTTDMHIGPDGYMYIVSLSSGAVRRVRPLVETAYPTSFTINTGVLMGGNLNSIRDSDNDRLQIREAPPIALGLPSVAVTISGTSPVMAPPELRQVVEYSTTAVPAGAVTVRILMFDFQANAFDVVDSRAATGGDTVVEIPITKNASRYINQTTGEMRTRIQWFDPGTLFSFGWLGRIDQAVWKVRVQ